MKHMRRLICMALMIATVLSLSVSAFAAEYTFESTSDSEYYPSTSYPRGRSQRDHCRRGACCAGCPSDRGRYAARQYVRE